MRLPTPIPTLSYDKRDRQQRRARVWKIRNRCHAERWDLQRDYEGSYDGNGMGETFDKAVNTALGKILARPAKNFTAAEFRTACCTTAAP